MTPGRSPDVAATSQTSLIRRNGDFRALWLAQVFSAFGEFIVEATLIVWAITSIASGAAAAASLSGALVLAASLPRVLVGSLTGVLVDRARSKRHVMIFADVARAAIIVAFTLALLVARGNSAAQGVLVVALTLAISSASQLFAPARAVVMQRVVPAEDRSAAAGLATFGTTGVAILGASLGPALYSAVGPWTALLLNCATFLISAVLVRMVAAEPAEPEPEAGRSPASFWSDLRNGLAVVRSEIRLLLVAASLALYGFSLGVNNVALSLFGLRTLGLSPAQYGVLAAMFPAGCLVGALGAARLVERLGRVRSFVAALVALGLTYALYGLSSGFVVPAIGMFVLGVVFSVYVVSQGPVIQDAAPPEYMGRVTSLTNPILALASLVGTGVATLVLSGAFPLGVAESTLPRVCLLSGAVLLMVGGLVLARVAAAKGALGHPPVT